jgi:autotransporter-associated beta strand protein
MTANASSVQASITGKLSLQGATRSFTVGNGAAPIDLLISAAITNGASTAGITKAGAGTLQLAGANNYSGLTTVSAGTLSVAIASGLGATGQGTTVSSGAVLAINGAVVSGEALALTGATLQSDSGSNAWTGSIALTNTCSFAVGTGATLNLTGVLSGPGAATKTGDGTLIFSGSAANTYAGSTTVNQGTMVLGKAAGTAVPGTLTIGDGTGGADADVVRLDAAQQMPAGAAVTVNSSGLLNLNNASASLASLAGGGHVEFGGASALLTVGANNASSTFNGLVSGTGQLSKTGNGTFTLTGNNSYTGQTTVSNGTLIVNGTQAGSAVVVNASGVVGGTGRVGNLSGPGMVSPGTSPGMLSSGNVIFSSNTIFRVELNGTTAGTGYDQLNVSGTVSLAGTLNPTLGFTPAVNDSFTIIDNNASDIVTGTFNGLPQGSQIAIGGVVLQISYSSGAGANNVTLTRVAAGAPIISSISIQGNAASVQGSGQAGLAYVLESTASLASPISWSAVGTNNADTNGIFQFIHADALALPERFYRVRSP